MVIFSLKSRFRSRARGAVLRAAKPALLAATLGAGAAHSDTQIEEMRVSGRSENLVGEARSASEGVIGQFDLALRPLLRPGDVLESIPGMIVTQHSGSGKSNQMFIRGFNLDHGTDLATWIDGMPLNMRSHGHGQGYTDINFLIPETVESLRFVKGPYHAELGDFSSAGGSFISTLTRAPQPQVKLGLGANGYRRLLAMGGGRAGEVEVMAALEGQTYDGPWTDIDEDVDKINGLLTLSGNNGGRHWQLTAMYYDNRWNAADQLPARAVASGQVDERGSLDDTLGGASRRASLSGQYRGGDAANGWQWSAYAIDYRMQLWSNFTYFLDDPVLGDQFEQRDERAIWGGSAQSHWTSGARQQALHRLGSELRYDDIDTVGLYHSRQRQRLGTVREDRVKEGSAAVFYELSYQFNERWRSVAGLRADYYHFDVDADNAANGGHGSAQVVSPKGSLIYTLSANSEVYLSAGRGFHSNDARGTTIRQQPLSGAPAHAVDPLVASRGAELGFKTVWLDGWHSAVALWSLELDSELLFVGDAGTTEASRPSRRHGLEVNNYWLLDDVWTLEMDLAWTKASFNDAAAEGKHIPGAIPFVATAALSADYPSGAFTSVRLRHFAGYPLSEDDRQRADGSTIASLAAGWRGERWSVQVDVLNLLDADDHDIDYYYASRLPGEPAGGIEDNHYKVFEPRQWRLYVGYSY